MGQKDVTFCVGRFHLTIPKGKNMARKSSGFNLSEVIRQYSKAHPGTSAKDSLEGIKRLHSDQKINESTFKATFYKLIGAGGGRRSVRRRKPGRVVMGNGSTEAVLKAGLHFVRLAGGVSEARERLVGIPDLIETAKSV